MGVLGWTPTIMTQECSVFDLCDAYDGYFTFHKSQKTKTTVSSDFLSDMMKRFPDQ